MEWKTTWNDPLTSYVTAFDDLIGDKRTRKTFGEIVRRIIGAGSLIWKPIAGGIVNFIKFVDELSPLTSHLHVETGDIERRRWAGTPLLRAFPLY